MVSRRSADPSFIVELKHWRDVRGYSRRRLAALIGCQADHLESIERGLLTPSASLVSRADEILRAGGAITTAWRHVPQVSTIDAHVGQPADTTGGQVWVRDDRTFLRFADHSYRVRHVRRIVNAGSSPLTSYLVHISVDRYPGAAGRSQPYHRAHPLEMAQLEFSATCGGKPVTWRVVNDEPAYKEIVLLFDSSSNCPPIAAGDEAELDIRYVVSDRAWGKWLQRIVRHPTTRMSVDLSFPVDLTAEVWGSQVADTAAALPIRGLSHSRRDGVDAFFWSVGRPALDSSFRLEWRVRTIAPDDDEYALPTTAQQTMTAAGIVQRENLVLRQRSRPFALPDEASHCSELLHLMRSTLDRLSEVHQFGKGMGLAAVQIGEPRAAAIVRLNDDQEISLINPRVLHLSRDSETHYEGCLSFFDERGRVERPRSIVVQYRTLRGEQVVREFKDGAARLIQHEIDHVDGKLYVDRMHNNESLIPLSEYSGIGRHWDYQDQST